MADNANQDELESLKQRLDQAKKLQESKQEKRKASGAATSIAFRMGIELVIAVMIGAYVGYLLDGWLDTKPLLMVIFFFLGIAAGIKNVFRAAEQMQNTEVNGPDKDGPRIDGDVNVVDEDK
jgi:ATP synthase protein I